jgi:hypothetical protein
LDITGTVGYEAFNTRYLFRPEALVVDFAGGLVAPLINRTAIRAEYQSANARQLQSVYNYQQVVLNAFTEVINALSKVENYRQSVEFKKGQLTALESSVGVASKLFQNARAEYVEVLLAQRDLLEARTLLINTKQQQLSAIVNAYQALGGGTWLSNSPENTAGLDSPPPQPEPVEAIPPLLPLAPDPLPGGNTRLEAPSAPGQMVERASFEGLTTDRGVIHLAAGEPNAVEHSAPPSILQLPPISLDAASVVIP